MFSSLGFSFLLGKDRTFKSQRANWTPLREIYLQLPPFLSLALPPSFFLVSPSSFLTVCTSLCMFSISLWPFSKIVFYRDIQDVYVTMLMISEALGTSPPSVGTWFKVRDRWERDNSTGKRRKGKREGGKVKENNPETNTQHIYVKSMSNAFLSQ